MNVKELIEQLQEVDPELEVLGPDDWPISYVEEAFWNAKEECCVAPLDQKDDEKSDVVKLYGGN